MMRLREYKFSDLLIDGRISYGIVQPGSHTETNSVPIVRVNNIKNGMIKTDDVLKVSSEIEKKYQRTRLVGGELLITVVGSVGECAIVSDSLKGWNVARAVSVARVKDEFDKKFIKYCFKSEEVKFQMYGNTNDTVQPTLNLSSLKLITLRLPTLPEQKAIAAVLSSLDDKIDLLHRQNKTLEALAETLFRQWFVEEAREDWDVGTLNDIVEFNPIYKLKKGDIAPYLEMGKVSTTSFSPTGWYEREFNSGMKFKNGDTLLARITPCLENGKKCFVNFLENDQIGCGSTEYIVMRMKDCYSPFISYLIAKDRDFRDFAISSMSGSSGRQRAQATIIKEYDIKIPPSSIIHKLNHQLEAFIPKLNKNATQIQTLSKLRDTLLPKLMSGEVLVKSI